jgi:hypothetical protein
LDLAEDDILQKFGGNVAEVTKVVERQHHGQIGIDPLDVACDRDCGFDSLFRSTGGSCAGPKLLRIPRVLHLLKSGPEGACIGSRRDLERTLGREAMQSRYSGAHSIAAGNPDAHDDVVQPRHLGQPLRISIC